MSSQPASDFQLVDDLFKRIADKKDAVGEDGLTTSERVVYFTWGALGILENGSFQYFFENNMNAEAVAKSLDLLGLTTLACAVREANDKISEGRSNSWEQKLGFLRENEAFFDSLAQHVVQCGSEIERKLAIYIPSHAAFFSKGN